MADILVVDDDNDVATPLIIFLEMEGHTVRYASDGDSGLAEFEARWPELVLLDIEMPKLTGPEMAYRLLVEDAGREKVPIIVISGVDNIEQVAKEVGTPYFLSKPFGLDALHNLLSKALQERQAPHSTGQFGLRRTGT